MSILKLVTVIGTRPEIIRLSEIIKLADDSFDHILVHTGQNFDYTLNEIFFEQLGLRKPDYFLGVTGNHLGDTIGNIISKSYDVFLKERPDALLVLGDTNSVLCTIPAKRLKIPIFHMEAGNRCFDQNVPEEINRKISDHISDINLTYTEHSRRYLSSEGFRKDHIFVSGSPLYEVIQKNMKGFEESNILNRLNINSGKYFVVSAHREENIDLEDNFYKLAESLNVVASEYQMPIIFSTHPRTKNRLSKSKFLFNKLIINMPPFGFYDYIKLQMNAYCVLSDSGTISEESSILNFPAVLIRTSTERPEAIEAGTVILGGITTNGILNSIKLCLNTFKIQEVILPQEYTVMNVSTKVVRIIQGYTSIVNRTIWNKDL